MHVRKRFRTLIKRFVTKYFFCRGGLKSRHPSLLDYCAFQRLKAARKRLSSANGRP